MPYDRPKMVGSGNASKNAIPSDEVLKMIHS